MFKKLAIGLGSVIVIAAIVICAVPLTTVSYAVSVPYEDTELIMSRRHTHLRSLIQE